MYGFTISMISMISAISAIFTIFTISAIFTISTISAISAISTDILNTRCIHCVRQINRVLRMRSTLCIHSVPDVFCFSGSHGILRCRIIPCAIRTHSLKTRTKEIPKSRFYTVVPVVSSYFRPFCVPIREKPPYLCPRNNPPADLSDQRLRSNTFRPLDGFSLRRAKSKKCACPTNSVLSDSTVPILSGGV